MSCWLCIIRVAIIGIIADIMAAESAPEEEGFC
jgi:hypothetical protein